MSMDAPTMDVLRKQAIAMAMLWLTARDYEHEGGRAWFHVRARDLGLREDVLPGKRIRVTIEAEEDVSGVALPASDEPPRWIELKTDAAPWHAVDTKRKTFEIRFNDRNYQPGDGLLLRKTRYTGAEMKEGKPLEYMGEPLRRIVMHVMTGPLYGLAEGWAILSIKPYGVALPDGGQKNG